MDDGQVNCQVATKLERGGGLPNSFQNCIWDEILVLEVVKPLKKCVLK